MAGSYHPNKLNATSCTRPAAPGFQCPTVVLAPARARAGVAVSLMAWGLFDGNSGELAVKPEARTGSGCFEVMKGLWTRFIHTILPDSGCQANPTCLEWMALTLSFLHGPGAGQKSTTLESHVCRLVTGHHHFHMRGRNNERFKMNFMSWSELTF